MQEALPNVTKHAQAQEAEIRLAVSDRGVGVASDRGGRRPGLGLVSMRERTRLVGGTVELRSAPGGGTTLTVRIPDETAKGAPVGA